MKRCVLYSDQYMSTSAFLLNIHLSWHVHEQQSGDGSLSLTISLLGTMQSVSFEHTEQVLLPTSRTIM